MSRSYSDRLNITYLFDMEYCHGAYLTRSIKFFCEVILAQLILPYILISAS